MTDSTAPAKTASPYGPRRPKVPPFARYVGTSVWRSDRRKVREYNRFCAKMTQLALDSATPAT